MVALPVMKRDIVEPSVVESDVRLGAVCNILHLIRKATNLRGTAKRKKTHVETDTVAKL